MAIDPNSSVKFEASKVEDLAGAGGQSCPNARPPHPLARPHGIASPQGKLKEADLACERAVRIGEKNLGVDNPQLVVCHFNRVQVLKAQVI